MDVKPISFGSVSNIKRNAPLKGGSSSFSIQENAKESSKIRGGGAANLTVLIEDKPDEQKKKRAIKNGKSLLSELKTLNLALLEGRVTPQLLERINSLLLSQSLEKLSPDLQSLLLEIETRASVELAKLNYSRS